MEANKKSRAARRQAGLAKRESSVEQPERTNAEQQKTPPQRPPRTYAGRPEASTERPLSAYPTLPVETPGERQLPIYPPLSVRASGERPQSAWSEAPIEPQPPTNPAWPAEKPRSRLPPNNPWPEKAPLDCLPPPYTARPEAPSEPQPPTNPAWPEKASLEFPPPSYTGERPPLSLYPKQGNIPDKQQQSSTSKQLLPSYDQVAGKDEMSIWFNAVDEDGNGHITAEELQQALLNEDCRPFSLQTCHMLIRMFDDNLNGEIELGEFIQLNAYVKKWRQIFLEHDADGSGTIELDELIDCLNAVHLPKVKFSQFFCAQLMRRFGKQRTVDGVFCLGLDTFLALSARMCRVIGEYLGDPEDLERFLLTCVV